MRAISSLARKVITDIRSGNPPDDNDLLNFYNKVRSSQSGWTDKPGVQGDVVEFLTAVLKFGLNKKSIRLVYETTWEENSKSKSKIKQETPSLFFVVPMSPNDPSRSISDLVNSTSVIQTLSGNKPYGDNRVFTVKKRQLFYKPPQVLTVTMNRYTAGFDAGGKYFRNKIRTPVLDPLKLTISKDSIYKGTNDIHYEADALIEHVGVVGAGHYISYIKLPSGKWFKCNDARVTSRTIDEIRDVAKGAYVISYRRTN